MNQEKLNYFASKYGYRIATDNENIESLDFSKSEIDFMTQKSDFIKTETAVKLVSYAAYKTVIPSDVIIKSVFDTDEDQLNFIDESINLNFYDNAITIIKDLRLDKNMPDNILTRKKVRMMLRGFDNSSDDEDVKEAAKKDFMNGLNIQKHNYFFIDTEMHSKTFGKLKQITKQFLQETAKQLRENITGNTFSDEVQRRVRYVFEHSEDFSGYYLSQKFGMDKGNISKIRSGKRPIDKLSLKTISEALDAYDSKHILD